MIQITINKKGLRADAVENIVSAAVKAKWPDASVSVSRKEPPESRSDRFSEAQGMVCDAKSEAESLRDELQEWRDGLPENLQSGSKADELETAISELDEFISNCEQAEGNDVSFPAMY